MASLTEAVGMRLERSPSNSRPVIVRLSWFPYSQVTRCLSPPSHQHPQTHVSMATVMPSPFRHADEVLSNLGKVPSIIFIQSRCGDLINRWSLFNVGRLINRWSPSWRSFLSFVRSWAVVCGVCVCGGGGGGGGFIYKWWGDDWAGPMALTAVTTGE